MQISACLSIPIGRLILAYMMVVDHSHPQYLSSTLNSQHLTSQLLFLPLPSHHEILRPIDYYCCISSLLCGHCLLFNYTGAFSREKI
ncbi:hypothetical protein LSTR_LSTR016847 [Laodelphax striatellus]|uniref:Uncharacterized protein n=1 Tax=Laodelphax striatellus TaxID=195883 RepID=A0A482WE45_LAOST|nr:hypothetical protein LSTR_LSTR016847 [Laodelphax striatellus]